jgi:hypothetical protein
MSGSITAFAQSWWVPSRICSVPGGPDGYSAATAIVTTGSNWVIGLLMGSGCVKARSSTMSFCLVTSYGSFIGDDIIVEIFHYIYIVTCVNLNVLLLFFCVVFRFLGFVTCFEALLNFALFCFTKSIIHFQSMFV